MRSCFLLLFFPIVLIAKPLVLVSVPPQKYLVEEITGGFVEVSVIVPPGASPHTFEPSPKQVTHLLQASLWFRIGEDFERRLLGLFSGRIVDQREGVDLLGCHCCKIEGRDPHIWLSPSILKQMSEQICLTLSALHPDRQVFFEGNLQHFLDRLKSVENQLKDLSFPSSILVSHPAFGYFCRDFAIEQIAIEMDGKEPTPKQVTELLFKIQKSALKKVFLQRQYSIKGGLAIARELDLESIFTDPYAEDVLANLVELGEVFSD